MPEFPDWSTFTPAFAAAELPRLLDEAEKKVSALEAAAPSTYETLVWSLNDATRPLWTCWSKVAHLNSVMNAEAWRKVEEDFQPRLVGFSLRVGQSAAIFAATKRARDVEGDPTRRRILDKMLEHAEHAGVGLEGEKRVRFNTIQAELAKLAMDFSNAVIDATKAFKYEKGGETYTIDDANYPETMKQCADREVREMLYRARVTRASENGARIDRILALRQEKAELLGFANYADLSLSTKCAPSVDAALAMTAELDRATARAAAAEASDLQEEAKAGHLTKVEPWDQAYLAERLRERKFSYREEELKRHFEFGQVLEGLFRMARFLFDIEIAEVSGADKPSVWHPDVRFFAVRERGQTIAHFYLDPYVRPGLKQGGAWMNEFENRDVRRGALPLALLALNNKAPDAEGKTYLPMREVETIFHEFGHALQCMLTRVDEEDAAGINLVEWDAVEVASQFMENWCLDDRTGIAVPAELKAKVRAAKNFRAASVCRRQLAFGELDLRLHAAKSPSSPDQVKCDIFAHYGLPMIPEDRFLCGFTHIFAGGYAAGYYGYKWAEVMSADCYGAFEEAGLGDAAVRAMGRRYRETILALGGSKSAREVFRDFRGRDPDSVALLRQTGILKKSQPVKSVDDMFSRDN